MSKEHELAVALIKFRQAWKELTDISKPLDTDLTEGYPFFLIDFEEVTPNVIQWCNIHASRIIKDTPDRLLNPTCLRCQYAFAGIDKSGMCIGQTKGIDCGSYPEIPFNRDLIIAALAAVEKREDLQKLGDDNLLILYVDYVQSKRKESDSLLG